MSRNASDTLPAKLLVFYVKAKGTPPTVLLEGGESNTSHEVIGGGVLIKSAPSFDGEWAPAVGKSGVLTPPNGRRKVVRIFLAGASGVIGQRLIPRLVQAGHVVGGMTRSASKMEILSHLGAEPILCDVFDREALIQAVGDFKPDVVLNELTDLPDDAAQISQHEDLDARIRTEGNQNLIEAARRGGSPKILAQSVAWQLPDGPDAQAVAELERSILAEGGVVLRYGRFYGPGTYNQQQPPRNLGFTSIEPPNERWRR